MNVRAIFWGISLIVFGGIAGLAWFWPAAWWALVVALPLMALGIYDMLQTKHAIMRNYPVIGHGRYMMEAIRPEINQYFIESETSGRPFNREYRSVMYQRAKNVRDTVPFGTILDVYEPGYEWIEHSLSAKHFHGEAPRIRVGGPACTQPYDASLYNISAMSYGSLSHAAVSALNRGAKMGGFAHNTGEGGISPHHLQGGDLIFQVGTGYFGARAKGAIGDCPFSPEVFAENALRPEVKMIELKLSQGAKPGHGGILPAAKVNAEIAAIRSVEIGKTVISPPTHSAFEGPTEMLHFIAKLRELSGGKPVGFKLCVGSRKEFFSICKAMAETGIKPDFIAVDGGEGGTGAAPVEFSNRMGAPLLDGLAFVHSALVGSGLRSDIKLVAAGKIMTGFHMARALAVGADLCYSARGMMFALGCIQARACNANTCPVGVTTHRPHLVAGLVVADKAERTKNYHRNTVRAFMELLYSAGLDHPDELRPGHIHRRISRTSVQNYSELFHYLETDELLTHPPADYAEEWAQARADAF
jgi:glutamate synthase domain-containing protein 2